MAGRVVDRPVGPADPHPAAVAAHVLVLTRQEVLRPGAEVSHEGAKVAPGRVALGHDGADHVFAEHLLGPVAEEALGELVDEGDAAGAVQAQDDAVGVLDQFPVAGLALPQDLPALLEFGCTVPHRPPQGAVPEEEGEDQGAGAPGRAEQHAQGQPIEQGEAAPLPVDGGPIRLRDGGEASLDLGQQGTLPPGHGPVEIARLQGQRGVESPVQVILVQVVEGRRLVGDKDVDLVVAGRLDDRLVALEQQQVVDAAAAQVADDRIALLDGHGKAAQRVDVGDAADLVVEEGRDLDLGVGPAEFEPAVAFLGAEGGVDDVVAAGPHGGLGVVPVQGGDLDRNAGALLPQTPQVRQDALGGAAAVEKHVGRVGVVHDHPQGAIVGQGRTARCGPGGKQQQQQQAQPDHTASSAKIMARLRSPDRVGTDARRRQVYSQPLYNSHRPIT